MPGKKILMLTGEFTEEYEIFVFQQAMEAVGHTVHVICPDKKAGEIIKTSLHDFEGHQTYTEKLGHDFVINKTFSDVRPEEYDRSIVRADAARNISAPISVSKTLSATFTKSESRSSQSVMVCRS
jgi:putative intracellular protease/amidase